MAGVGFIMAGFIGGFFYGDFIEDLTMVSFIRDLTAGDFTQGSMVVGLIGDFTTDVCLSFLDGRQPLVLCLSPLNPSIG